MEKNEIKNKKHVKCDNSKALENMHSQTTTLGFWLHCRLHDCTVVPNWKTNSIVTPHAENYVTVRCPGQWDPQCSFRIGSKYQNEVKVGAEVW